MATPPQKSLMALPTELRLKIIECAVEEDTSHNFETSSDSSTGETLFQLWRRLFIEETLYKMDTQTYHMTRWGLWSSLSNISTPAELYTYRPRVPEILHANQTISGEGRELYLKFARKQMASYEARHKELLPLFIDGYEAWKVRPYVGPGTCIGHREDELRVEGMELAYLCIRWYALKQISEFLEKDGGEESSVDAK